MKRSSLVAVSFISYHTDELSSLKPARFPEKGENLISQEWLDSNRLTE